MYLILLADFGLHLNLTCFCPVIFLNFAVDFETGRVSRGSRWWKMPASAGAISLNWRRSEPKMCSVASWQCDTSINYPLVAFAPVAVLPSRADRALTSDATGTSQAAKSIWKLGTNLLFLLFFFYFYFFLFCVHLSSTRRRRRRPSRPSSALSSSSTAIDFRLWPVSVCVCVLGVSRLSFALGGRDADCNPWCYLSFSV